MTVPLAVYGSLRLGLALAHQPAEFDDLLGDLGHRRTCRIPGRLVDLGPYPGLLGPGQPGSGGTPSSPGVIGELCQLADEEALTVFDRYEGYDPADPDGSAYLRVWVDLLTPAGTAAWVYHWNGPWTSEMLVASGDWARERT